MEEIAAESQAIADRVMPMASPLLYSYRKARTGCTRDARLAGM